MHDRVVLVRYLETYLLTQVREWQALFDWILLQEILLKYNVVETNSIIDYQDLLLLRS